MKTIDSLEYMTADDYFTPQEKQLFLAIPHKVESLDKIDYISFDVPENGKYPVLSRVHIAHVKEIINDEESSKYRKMLHYTSFYNEDDATGYFINSNQGSHVLYLMQELYRHDKVNGEKLLSEYYELAVHTEDITSIEERFVRQEDGMQAYLQKKKLVVQDYGINTSVYDDKDDEQMEQELKSLRTQYSKIKNFPAYNDLDYIPMMLGNDYAVYDSASAIMYLVVNDNNSKKIYMIDRDRGSNKLEMNDWLQDFMYDHRQIYIHLKNSATPANLIGEIKDGKLVKASCELLNMDRVQSYIYSELLDAGKIVEKNPDMSFQDLLQNYAKQKQFYHVEERSILPLLSTLKVVDDKLTYDDFSFVKSKTQIIHEEIGEHTLKDLKFYKNGPDNTPDASGMRQLWITDIELKHLVNLPQKYKEQINEYLDELLERDNTPCSQEVVAMIKAEMDSPAPIKKPKM